MEFLAKVRAAAPEMKKKQKSVIVLWMAGGPATIDIWDMKPGTTTEGRTIPKSTPARASRSRNTCPPLPSRSSTAIIRSLNSKEGDHNRGTPDDAYVLQPNPPIDFPAIASAPSYYRRMDIEAMKNADRVHPGGRPARRRPASSA